MFEPRVVRNYYKIKKLMKEQINIQLVFVNKETYTSVYHSNYKKHESDLGFYYQLDNGQYEAHVMTNTGWKIGSSSTETGVQKVFKKLYEEYSNQYEYHIRCLFPRYRTKNITVN